MPFYGFHELLSCYCCISGCQCRFHYDLDSVRGRKPTAAIPERLTSGQQFLTVMLQAIDRLFDALNVQVDVLHQCAFTLLRYKVLVYPYGLLTVACRAAVQ